MSMVETTSASVPVQPQPSFGTELKTKITQFSAALPKHIPQERFARVVMTAVQRNPDLLRADRQSLWNSAMQAASDGLLPDGREGALVIYNTKEKDAWIKKVQWMPMIAGIRKKVRNSKELSDWHAQVVHSKDHFDYALGDNPFIDHKPFTGEGDPGPVIAAYSVATFRDGGDKSREVMTRAQLEKVRNASKSKDKGPWVDWFEEMCRKSVARRHSKILPMSTDLDDIMRRDEALYDLQGASDKVAGNERLSLTSKLDALANMADPSQDAPMLNKPGVASTEQPEETRQDETGSDQQAGQIEAVENRPADKTVSKSAASAATNPANAEAKSASDDSPREQLLTEIRERIEAGERVNAILNTLGDQRELITDEDVKALRGREKKAGGGQG